MSERIDPHRRCLINLHGVGHQLGGRSVLSKIYLQVDAGECLALVGANGAGKSTLIKAMLDIGGLDAGRIHIDGIPHTDRRARTQVAYLPERFQPPYYLLGREFLAYMLALYGKRAADAPIDTMCAALGLSPAALGQPVQSYSKGMSQMLGLAACLLAERPLLVLDEPMSGLDPVARMRLRDVLRERHAAGTTILFTTHLLADAEMLADRVAMLHAGEIRAVGTSAAICEQFNVASLDEAFAACLQTAPAAVAPH